MFDLMEVDADNRWRQMGSYPNGHDASRSLMEDTMTMVIPTSKVTIWYDGSLWNDTDGWWIW